MNTEQNTTRGGPVGDGLPVVPTSALPEVSLNPSVAADLADYLQRLLHVTQPHTHAQWSGVANAAADALVSVEPRLVSMAEALKSPSGPEAVVIRNLPVDDVIEVESPTPLGKLVSLGLVKFLGEPFQYTQQNGGEVVAALYPKPAFVGKANTGESNLQFADHTDDRPWAPEYSCEWIQLLGMVNDSNVATTYTAIAPVVAELPDATRQVLCEPRFVSKAPASFGFRMQLWTPPVPVLWKNAVGQWEVGLPTYNCRPATDSDAEAAQALAVLKSLLVLPRFRIPVVVGKGVALIFANNRGLHGRDGFEGRRLVLRTYISRSLEHLRRKTGEAGPVFDAWSLLR